MEWKKTACCLCGNGCGLEVSVQDNRIVKVRGDKDCLMSQGYICRKGMNIAAYQHSADRLRHPLKRVGSSFEQISWDQAITEITSKLKEILDEHGPRALASLIGGGEMGIGFKGGDLQRFVGGLGSKYHYSSGNQEFAGRYWAHGLTLGGQGIMLMADHHNADMMMMVGKNPLMSHNFPQARKELRKASKDPDQLLVVVDPRLSETAKIADIHLAIRPGTDALLIKSMITIILRKELHNADYIAEHADGFDKILPWFADFDIKGALKVCELDYDQVVEVSRQFATRQSCLHDDLGILMNRHSGLVSYLIVVLLTICGRISVPGGHYLASGFLSVGDPNDPEMWMTQTTDIPALNGAYPPNVMPEEIMSDHPDRLRAVFTHAVNPLRSYADTTAYEQAFRRLDLLVVTETAMSETAALAHYILPAKSGYETWSSTLGGDMVTKLYGRALGPVVAAEGEQKEGAEIVTLLADAMGLIPEIPESLRQTAASGDLGQYWDALMGHLTEKPENWGVLPFIAAKTLGKAIGSTQLAAHFIQFQQWGLPEAYQATIDHPEGVLVIALDPAANFWQLGTESKKIQLHSPEVDEWIGQINPEDEERSLTCDEAFPLILMAGRHIDMNANTMMRNPDWNKGRRFCTLAMNPADAENLELTDGETAKIITEAAEETIEVEVTDDARKGQVIIPHGFGLVHDGVTHGVNVNRLTKATHRDRFGTPIHRYVPCRVEAL